jgi:ribosomal protein L21
VQNAVRSDIAAGRPLFAVVHVAGKQYKVAANDIVVTGHLDCPVGTNIRLEKVLLVGAPSFTLIGQPTIE